MKVFIVEDEYNARIYLERLVTEVIPEVKILGHADSIKKAVNDLNADDMPDLIFLDIQLADGLSFEIFSHIDVNCPVIFTTAYDQYAIDAFKVHSIDYLLKPIDPADLRKALEKYERFYADNGTVVNRENIIKASRAIPQKMKQRCLVKRGGFYDYVEMEQVALVHSEDSLTFLYTKDGRRHLYNKTVEALYDELDKSLFFQINRSQVVHIASIREIHPYLNQRLLLKLDIPLSEEINVVVSRSKLSSFKGWVDS